MNAIVELKAEVLSKTETKIQRLWDETEQNRLAIGGLLLDVREQKLWKDGGYQSFEDYLERRWGWSKAFGSMLISAYSIRKNMFTMVNKKEELKQRLNESKDNLGDNQQVATPLPKSERQTRPLTKLKEPELQYKAWSAAVEESGDNPTAAVVEKHAKRVEAESKEKAATKKENPPEFNLNGTQAPGKEIRPYITLDEWKALSDEQQAEACKGRVSSKTFNQQNTDSIEWARWSWNPVTGCLHDCPYCYARDIAERFESSAYPQGFTPTLLPDRLLTPQTMKVPEKAADDISYRNVFTCSMADLFGRWVPGAWIETVLQQVADNPQWNFLFLTKFPKRMAEFQIPKNAWMGTTVDCQARVKNAERAFEKVDCEVKWLSVEPLLEPLYFDRLNLFQWLVIGGASRSSKTPAWTPPIDWIADLHRAGRMAGCKIYYKTNCGMSDDLRIREFPWQRTQPVKVPAVFQYLKKAKTLDAKPERI